MFKVNGVSPPVGADAVTLKDGDHVLWYWATFGPEGGPPTLSLRAGTKRNCYRVLAQDDTGKTKAARGARLHVDGRSVLARSGSACLGRHRAREGDAQGRRPVERLQVKRAALAAALAVALAGCGSSSATGPAGRATLWVTRDRGAHVLHVAQVPAGYL